MIGGVGLYELDMTQGTGVVTSINFDEMSLTNIDENQDAYLLIDILYETEGS